MEPAKVARGSFERPELLLTESTAREQASTELSSCYRAAEFFLVRSPLIPLSRVRAWTEASGSCVSWRERRGRLELELLKEFDSAALRGAVLFAAPEVERMLDALDRSASTPPKLLRTLTKYFLRAAGRETPFGWFSGVSLGSLASRDRLELPAAERYRAYTRISLGGLRDLLTNLARASARSETLPHVLTSTAAVVQGNYQCVVRESLRGQDGTSELELEGSPALELCVTLARAGAAPCDLIDALVAEGHDRSRARVFVERLREVRLLEPAWLPCVTGVEPLSRAVAQLEQRPELFDTAQRLRQIGARLREADAAPFGENLPFYRAANQQVVGLFDQPAEPCLLQTDLIKPAPELTISRVTARRFLTAASLVQRTGRAPRDRDLDEFARRFAERYQARLVPLAEVANSDVGLGFGGAEPHADDALLADVPLRPPAVRSAVFDELDLLRQRLLHRALASGSISCELGASELAEFGPHAPAPPLPESLAVVARLARDADGRTWVVAPMVVPVAPMLGRFCEAMPELHSALRRLLADEEALSPGCVLSDVAYMPPDRAANIVGRPTLRSHEIPYQGKSGASSEQQLPIDDLLVGVDDEGVVALYSKRLAKRVLVRVASAHNFGQASSPAVYRLLGALQRQDTGLVPQWSWGVLEEAEFLPRVWSGETVLSLARWRLPEAELKALAALPAERGFAGLQKLRHELKLPRWLTRGDSDQRQLIDLDNELSVEELIHAAKRRGGLSVEELLPGPDQLPLNGPEGAFAAEFVVPFLRTRAAPSAAEPLGLRHAAEPLSVRRRSPGSDWLYAKIYAPRGLHSRIVRQLRDEVVVAGRKSAIRDWFFLPYADPEPHVRVRFRGPKQRLRNAVLSRLEQTLEPLMESGTVWRWELSTYERELERYGGSQHAELAEQVFHADSEAACSLHELCEGDGELRWQLALVGIDRLLRDAGFDLTSRLMLARYAADGYAAELGADVAALRVIGEKYKLHAAELGSRLWPRARPDPDADRADEILSARSRRLASVWAEYGQLSESGALTLPLSELALTFSHLHALRMLGVNARRHELMLYQFLRRQYAAQQARLAPRAQEVLDSVPA